MYKKKWYDDQPLLKYLYIDRSLTVDEIAEKFGVSSETARKLLIKHNLKRSK